MKKLADLKGVKALSKIKQKSINGGLFRCSPFGGSCHVDSDCCQDNNPGGSVWCINRVCIPD